MKKYLAGIILPVLCFLSPTVANAQVETTIQPTQITIAGNRIEKQPSRQIFVQTNSPIQDLQVLALDLNSRDGITIFPASGIISNKSNWQTIRSNQIIVPVEFNLSQAPSSGEYLGNLRLTYTGGELTLPITLQIKDWWLPPLLVLFLGTGLGILVSVYRAQGRPRDEVLVRIGQLQTQMQEDIEFVKITAFKQYIEGCLIEVKMDLQTEKWEQAIAILEQTENIWKRWVKGRSDWLQQFDYCQQIRQQLEDKNPNDLEIKAILRNLEATINDAPELETPEQFRERLEKIYQQMNQLVLENQKQDLKALIAEIPLEKRTTILPEFEQLEAKIATESLANPKQFKALTTELNDLTLKAQDIGNESSPRGVISKSLFGFTGVMSPPPVTNRSTTSTPETTKAGVRLKLFTWTSYAIAVIFLAGTGFSQLYIDNPTFGANPWKDYFALMAWGFGAEATRDAITKVVQSWNLPGLK
ncbi:hypothetical protein L2E69_18600 [Planktothrix agardhii 1806]|uniref:hypothetical protein n=1 Tax=Planktothrix agardhii TaxID=1160 RepID=UPI001F31F077|nr:hypothetical protein [Planktothrix agardhii]MCF3572446.1 hypothetical protein [Planktothrix agardhii 1805]MCF3584465.1 hypothetical protein [Planktothrix agardhii 1803]MCF3601149.1 hypothetical protein [Planktothrix agardhii 1804]MCF3617941.1 hypothetical protein [Planktothrix agardhii 1806]